MLEPQPHFHPCTFGCSAGCIPASRVLPADGRTRVRWGVDYHRHGMPPRRAKGFTEEDARFEAARVPGARLIRSTVTTWPDATSDDFAGAEFLGPWLAVPTEELPEEKRNG